MNRCRSNRRNYIRNTENIEKKTCSQQWEKISLFKRTFSSQKEIENKSPKKQNASAHKKLRKNLHKYYFVRP